MDEPSVLARRRIRGKSEPSEPTREPESAGAPAASRPSRPPENEPPAPLPDAEPDDALPDEAPAAPCHVLGGALVAVEGVAVEVEVRIHAQLPRVDIVGLPEAAVRESALRVRAAIAAVGQRFPDRRITVNLAPAGLRKSGAGLDLAIALGILAASGAVPAQGLAGTGWIGELALDGRLRPVRGALAQTLALADAGCARVVVPSANGREAALAPGVRVETADHLGQVLGAVIGRGRLCEAHPPAAEPRPPLQELAEIRGQESARRALELAAAGGHGLLLRGPPGAGKTLLARALPGLLPPLDPQEALEVARIHGASGLADAEEALRGRRPFRAPHHSASRAGLLGGGSPPRPGEVTLAHRGVLFLDELPEFERRALESLRQVLEEGRVEIARAALRVRLPARFQLVAAANPCPCGHHGSPLRDCRCDDGALARYTARLSGPLLDRIDLHVAVPPVSFSELETTSGGASSAQVAARVAEARARQAQRLAPLGLRTNAEIPPRTLLEQVRATPAARALLRRAVERLGLSARAAHRALRVARTAADLGGADEVGEPEIAEAVGYRAAAEP